MNVLFLTTILPRQQRMGSEVASHCFIEALRRAGHRVIVVGYMRRDDPFEPDATEVVVGQRYIETKRAKGYPLLWMLWSFLLNLPYSSAKYHSLAYRRWVKKLLAQYPNALVVFDHPQLGWLHPLIPPIHPLVMIAHNIEQDIYRQNARSVSHAVAAWIYRREAGLIQRWEDKLATAADQVWALTEQDAKHFASLTGAQVLTVTLPATLPAGFADPVPVQPLPKTCDIGLIGSWAWRPNQEGLRWFLQQVYPLLPSNLSVWIAGRGADWLSDPVQMRHYPNLRYCGFVPDAQQFMAQAKVVAIPTLSGSGIQIKTLDAIASGSQIVATPIALRGIADLPNMILPNMILPNTVLPNTVQVADRPEAFAAALIAAVRQPQPASIAGAQTWRQARQAQFLNQITQAIDNLAGSLQSIGNV